MVDSLLRLAYTATDPAAATEAARAVLGSAEVTSSGAPLSWKQVSLVDDGVSISRIAAFGDAVHLNIEKATELVVVHLRSGRAHLSNEHHETDLGPDQLGLIPLDGRARLRFSRAEFELFSVPPAPLARLLGVPRVAVQLHAPRITPRSEALAEYVRQVAGLLTTSVFGTPEVYDFDLLRTHTIDTLTASIVEAFELTNRTEDAADRDAPVLRRAIKELGAHLADPVSIPEVAHAAGVSVRGLQLIFQRQLGVSPLLHLRTLRLHAARDALIDEATMGTTVADIARRFGYSNSGRFSTHYRNEFGEPPATSLQRVRSRPVDDASAASEANIVTQAASSPNDPGATGESSHG